MTYTSKERIDRLGYLTPFGIAAYKQEVERHKQSNESNEIYTIEAIEFPDYLGTRINIVVGG